MKADFNEAYVPELEVQLDVPLDGWEDIHPARLGRLTRVGTVAGMTENGKPVVAMIVYADGVEEPILVSTTVALFLAAAKAMEGRYGIS